MPYKLNTFVHVDEGHEEGRRGRTAWFGPDDELPDWAVKAIANPDVWDGDVPPHLAPEDDEPARAAEPGAPPPATSPAGDTVQPLKRPTQSAPVAEWRSYVMATTDRSEADVDGLTKQQLVELADQAEK